MKNKIKNMKMKRSDVIEDKRKSSKKNADRNELRIEAIQEEC